MEALFTCCPTKTCTTSSKNPSVGPGSVNIPPNNTDRILKISHKKKRRRKSKKSRKTSLTHVITRPPLSLHKKAKRKKHKKHHKHRHLMIGGMGGGGGGASVKAGSTTIDFPAPVAPSKSPITINTPPAYYPQVMHDPSKNKPVLIVPEIIYPKKKKRVIVHHNVPMLNYYQNMFYNRISPYYMQMAKSNQNWAPLLENNDFYNQTLENEHYKAAMDAIKGNFPEDSSASKSSSKSSSFSSSRLII